jgi:hypothetical protein
VTALRAFLRFLSSTGAVPAGLVGAVPAVRTWRHSALPRAVSAEAVEPCAFRYRASTISSNVDRFLQFKKRRTLESNQMYRIAPIRSGPKWTVEPYDFRLKPGNSELKK